MFIDGTFIYWPEQCKYCSKSWTSEHCARNQSFMRKLKGMYQEYLGSLEFKCDYFTPDFTKLTASIEAGVKEEIDCVEEMYKLSGKEVSKVLNPQILEALKL